MPRLAERIVAARDSIAALGGPKPRMGLVLGSGLGGLAEAVSDRVEAPYHDIPGFVGTSVPGHAGKVIVGSLAGVPVVALAGRWHLYEGFEAQQTGFGIWVLAALGVSRVILTNAAGGIAPDLQPGHVLVIRDHINFAGFSGSNPLVGAEPEVGERFVSLAFAYDHKMRAVALSALRLAGLTCREGVYAMVAGPSFETPAEIRLLGMAGADAVGMSTVPEVIVARQRGLSVLALSLITNSHAVSSDVSHHEVIAAGQASANRLAAAVSDIVPAVADGHTD